LLPFPHDIILPNNLYSLSSKNFTTFCNNTLCEPINGFCSTNFTCECNSGYLHAPSIEPGNCKYGQRVFLKCLLLEILFPGLGCMYIGKVFWGLSKLILLPGIYQSWMTIKTDKLCDCFWIALAGYALLFFHFRDLYLIVTNRMKDDNGIPLYKNYL
jgi:TM2 domain-containing membrane protein YozV